jgi:hypothetical protein
MNKVIRIGILLHMACAEWLVAAAEWHKQQQTGPRSDPGPLFFLLGTTTIGGVTASGSVAMGVSENSVLTRYVGTMPSKPVTFKMSEVMRTVRGAEAAGKKVSTVEVDPATGIIRLAFDDGKQGPPQKPRKVAL